MNKKDTKRLTFMAMFLAIELVLVLTPLGYIPIPPLTPTTMHIPVIIAGIVLGKKAGAQLGFVFGLTSFLRATFQPTPTSFVFTPFYAVGGISGNWTSLLIAFIPRILLGFVAGWLFERMAKKKINEQLNIMIASIAGAMTNTILVMGGIYLFFAQPYAQTLGISYTALIGAIMSVVTVNGISEAVLGAIICVIVCKACKPYITKRLQSGKS